MRLILVVRWIACRTGQGLGRVRRAALMLTLAMAVVSCSRQPASPLELTDAWARAMPPGSRMTAAYGAFHWHGDSPLDIAGFESDAFGDISLHRTVRRDGMSRMEAVPHPRIEPGGQLELQPGGMHLMLMQPTREVQSGDTLELTLISDSGQRFRFDLPVRPG